MQNTSTYNTNRNRVRNYEYFVRTGDTNAVERKTLKISEDKQVIALYESDNTKLTGTGGYYHWNPQLFLERI